MDPPQAVSKLLDTTPARVGVAVVAVGDDRSFNVRANEAFTQASAIKVPILWALRRAAATGDLSLRETLPIDPANGAGGCGVLQQFDPGASRVALGDLAVLMMVLSDNVATNLLIDRIGLDAVNELLDSKGASETRLRRKMMDQAARDAGRENTSTPAEAVSLMVRLHDEESTGDPAAEAVLKTLRLKKESPVTEAILNEGVRLATKPGMLEGLRTEWSLVESRGNPPYAMAIMADGADDRVLKPLFSEVAATVHAAMTAAG